MMVRPILGSMHTAVVGLAPVDRSTVNADPFVFVDDLKHQRKIGFQDFPPPGRVRVKNRSFCDPFDKDRRRISFPRHHKRQSSTPTLTSDGDYPIRCLPTISSIHLSISWSLITG